MEKTISPEDRMKRAEEIYYRRKSKTLLGYKPEKEKREKMNISLLKKMFLRILICILIYVIFYLIKNTPYFFSEDVINKTKEILKYDINFQNLYNEAVMLIQENKSNIPVLNNLLNSNGEIGENVQTDNNNIEENVVEENVETENINQGGVGGGKEENTQVSEKVENTETKSQMEIDAEFLKANYSFIKPVVGTVTSRYGERTPTDIISANHYGIDIGANIGTPIFASTDGIVEQVSEEGEYGKHIKIRNGEAVTLYAHCSELLVEENEKVKQGDKIALVGDTGKATGPHLHFEIRRNNNIVNPDYILQF